MHHKVHNMSCISNIRVNQDVLLAILVTLFFYEICRSISGLFKHVDLVWFTISIGTAINSQKNERVLRYQCTHS